MKEVLYFDHLGDNVLFDDGLTAKPNKSELIKELENHLSSTDYNFTQNSPLRTAAMIDFMSQIRWYPTTKLKTFNDIITVAMTTTMNAPTIEQIDIIYDSYLEDSIKECERIRRRSTCEPLEFMNLKVTSAIPVQIDRFWGWEENKEALQLISRNLFKNICHNNHCRVIQSDYVTDFDDLEPCIEVNQEIVTLRSDLDSMIEEEDSRIIPHVEKAVLNGLQHVIVYSNDTDAVVYLLYDIKAY